MIPLLVITSSWIRWETEGCGEYTTLNPSRTNSFRNSVLVAQDSVGRVGSNFDVEPTSFERLAKHPEVGTEPEVSPHRTRPLPGHRIVGRRTERADVGVASPARDFLFGYGQWMVILPPKSEWSGQRSQHSEIRVNQSGCAVTSSSVKTTIRPKSASSQSSVECVVLPGDLLEKIPNRQPVSERLDHPLRIIR